MIRRQDRKGGRPDCRGGHRITEPEEGAPSDGWEGNAEVPDDVPKGGLPRPPEAV
jgi:hypothetical protein